MRAFYNKSVRVYESYDKYCVVPDPISRACVLTLCYTFAYDFLLLSKHSNSLRREFRRGPTEAAGGTRHPTVPPTWTQLSRYGRLAGSRAVAQSRTPAKNARPLIHKLVHRYFGDLPSDATGPSQSNPIHLGRSGPPRGRRANSMARCVRPKQLRVERPPAPHRASARAVPRVGAPQRVVVSILVYVNC